MRIVASLFSFLSGTEDNFVIGFLSITSYLSSSWVPLIKGWPSYDLVFLWPGVLFSPQHAGCPLTIMASNPNPDILLHFLDVLIPNSLRSDLNRTCGRPKTSISTSQSLSPVIILIDLILLRKGSTIDFIFSAFAFAASAPCSFCSRVAFAFSWKSFSSSTSLVAPCFKEC